MVDIISNILTGAISFLVGVALLRFEPRVRVIYWLSHEFHWALQNVQPPTQVYTHAISIQNQGRKTASGIEVVHATAPAFTQLNPALDHEVFATPTGEHGIRIRSLGPREYVTIEGLTINGFPRLLYVRSSDGPATAVQTWPIIPWPKWRQRLYALLALIGLVVLIYGLVRAGLLLWSL